MLFLLLCFLSIGSGCNSSSNDTTAYYQTIQSEVQQVRDEYLQFLELMGSKDIQAIQSKLNQLKSKANSSINTIQKVPTINNDFELKSLAIKQLEVLNDNLENRYPAIINLISIADMSEEEVEQLEDNYEKIEDLEEPLFEQFEKSGIQFCQHYKINQNKG